MILKNATVHMLVKEQREPIQKNVYRKTLLDIESEEVILLAQRLVDSYGKKENTAQYGVFREDDGRGDFPDAFIEYSTKHINSSKKFSEMTHSVMKNLYAMAESSPLATGGHIIFIDYEENRNRFHLITMVKQKEGLTVTDALEPKKLLQIDFSKLHNAARINITRLLNSIEKDNEEQQAYLSFINQRSEQQAAGYFIRALGCSAGLASSRATKTLFEQSNLLFRSDERLSDNSEQFEQELRAYVENCLVTETPIRLVDVKHLIQTSVPIEYADVAEEIADDFVSKLNSDEFAVPAEFQANKAMVKKFLNYKVKANGWQLVVSRDKIGTDPDADIYFNKDARTFTIRDVPEDFSLDN